MNDKTVSKVHWSFWVIAVVALIWNLLGVMNFVGQLDAETVASMPQSHQALIVDRPAWATAAFGVAVFAGVVGCILLLMKKSIAYRVFIVSLIGVVAQLIPSIRIASSTTTFSVFEMVLAFLMPVVVAVFLIWYSKYTAAKGWIG